ncbi:hypothetical protein D3C75_684600 [compost metagenome]
MELQAAHSIRQLLIIGNNQPAFGAGHVFDGVEGENRRSFVANMFAFVVSSRRVRSILNHRDPVAFAHRTDGVNIHRRSGVMNRDNGAGAGSNRGFNRLRRDHQRIAVNINHHRFATE